MAFNRALDRAAKYVTIESIKSFGKKRAKPGSWTEIEVTFQAGGKPGDLTPIRVEIYPTGQDQFTGAVLLFDLVIGVGLPEWTDWV